MRTATAVSGVCGDFAAPSSGASAIVRRVRVEPRRPTLHADHGLPRHGDIVDLHRQRHQRHVQHHRFGQRSPVGHVHREQQGQPDHHLHLDGAGAATVGGATYTPTATATSGLAVTITVDASSSTVCSINGGGVVSFTGAGTCTLDANQAGNATYNAAPQVQQSFTVQGATRPSPSPRRRPATATVGGATYTADRHRRRLGQRRDLHLGLDRPSAPRAATNGSVFTFVGSGTCVVNANQARQHQLQRGAPGPAELRRSRRNQTITFTSTAPGNATVGGATYTPTATATSAPGRDHHRRRRELGRVLHQRRRRGELHRRPAPAPSTPTRPATPPTTRRPRSSRTSP